MKKVRKLSKQLTIFLLSAVLAVGLITAVFRTDASADISGSDFQPGRIIDDSIFTNSNALSEQDIQNFLNAEVGTCDNSGTVASDHWDSQTKSYYTDGQWAALNGQSSTFTCINQYVENTTTLQNNFGNYTESITGGISAAQIIYNAAQEYQINPEVILATLQKEQGLVTDYWPWYSEYQYAMGYDCPDSSVCSSSDADFYEQVSGAAWQFRQYLTNPQNYTFQLGNNYVDYSPSAGCGGSIVYIQDLSTAALYDYTPYQPDQAALVNVSGTNDGGTGDSCSSYGNRNFWWYFNTWFGTSLTAYCDLNAPPAVNTGVQFQDTTSAPATAYFMIYSGSSTNCVEFHGWNSGETSWLSHTASNAPDINLANTEIAFADVYGNGQIVPVLIGLNNTSSGMVEFHVWNPGEQSFSQNIISNAPAINPNYSTIEYADLNGNGQDVPILISETANVSGSGNVELHVWNPGEQSFSQNIITNTAAINPTDTAIRFADLNGNGKDMGVLISETKAVSGSGNIEFHVWSPNFGSFSQNIISNSAPINPAIDEIEFADVNGNGVDQAVLVGGASGVDTSTGNIEFHVWNPGMTSWQSNIASNQSSEPQ